MIRHTAPTFSRFIIAAALLLAVGLGSQPAQALTCEVNPSNVPISLGYHGTSVVVTGTSAPGQQLIVKIASAPADTHLKYKGKAGGIFWMKLGTMEFKNLPSVYLLSSTSGIDQLLDTAERNAYALGYKALSRQAAIEGPEGVEVDHDQWFGEYITFKEKEQVYRVEEGSVELQQGPAGNQYRAEIHWPFQAPPGTYTVEVLAVENGKVVDQANASLEVERSGIVAQLSALAFNSAAMYGIIAIVIAMAAGFSVGAIFKGGGSH